MNNSNTVLTVIVIAFAAFIVAGLAITPALQEASANESALLKNTKDKKPNKHTDFPIDEPVIKLIKDKLKKPKKDKSDFTIEEPIIELVKDKPKKPKKHDFTIEEPVIELVKDVKKPKKSKDRG